MKYSIKVNWVILWLAFFIFSLMPVGSAAYAAGPTSSAQIFLNFNIPVDALLAHDGDSDLQFLSQEEHPRFVEVAQVFTHPETRQTVIDGEVSARLLLDTPSFYDGYHVKLTGNVINIRVVENLLPKNWQTAYVIFLDDGTAWVPVLYRGDVRSINYGDTLVIEGVFVAAGQAVHADLVYVDTAPSGWMNRLPVDLPFDLPHDLPITLPIVLIFLLAFGIFAILVGLSRRIFSLFVIPLILLVSLTSCEIHMETIVRRDGSVRVGTKIGESIENIDFLREIPGMQRYLSSWITQLRDDQVVIENFASGEKEYFYLQSSYPSLVEFSALDQDELSDSAPETWVYATSYQTETSDCFRYLALVNPQSLYTTPPNTDQAIIREMDKQIDQLEIKYHVTLPGQILYTNADQITGNRLKWPMATNEAHQVVAESCYHRLIRETMDWTWAWLGLGGLGLVDVGLWTWALRRRKNQSKIKN